MFIHVMNPQFEYLTQTGDCDSKFGGLEESFKIFFTEVIHQEERTFFSRALLF